MCILYSLRCCTNYIYKNKCFQYANIEILKKILIYNKMSFSITSSSSNIQTSSTSSDEVTVESLRPKLENYPGFYAWYDFSDPEFSPGPEFTKAKSIVPGGPDFLPKYETSSYTTNSGVFDDKRVLNLDNFVGQINTGDDFNEGLEPFTFVYTGSISETYEQGANVMATLFTDDDSARNNALFTADGDFKCGQGSSEVAILPVDTYLYKSSEDVNRRVIGMITYDGRNSYVKYWVNGILAGERQYIKDPEDGRSGDIIIGGFRGGSNLTQRMIKGHVSEIMVFKGALDIQHANALHKYLNLKWNVYEEEDVDLVTVAGQSNATGRGQPLSDAPEAFRNGYTITDGFNRLAGDFDMGQNPSMDVATVEQLRINTFNEPHDRQFPANTGSAWGSFANSYFESTGRKVIIYDIARSGASIVIEGGVWNPNEIGQPGNNILNMTEGLDVNLRRLEHEFRFNLKNKFVMWLQGESDENNDANVYRENLDTLATLSREAGYDFFSIIEVGLRTTDPTATDDIRQAQNAVANRRNFVNISFSKTKDFPELGLMDDTVHYTQKGYNLVGKESGKFVSNVVKGLGK